MATVKQINSDLANKLYDEARRDPRSPYAGKKVGIANGRVVVIADSWREVASRLDQEEPDASRTFCIDMAADYDTVHEIWEVIDATRPLAIAK